MLTLVTEAGTPVRVIRHMTTPDELSEGSSMYAAERQAANALVGLQHVELRLLGGYLRGHALAAVGDWVVSALSDPYTDIAFLGTDGISVSRGLTSPDQREARAKRAMLAGSREAVVLVDHTKVGVDHFSRFAPLKSISTVIADDGLSAKQAAGLAAAGPEVVRA